MKTCNCLFSGTDNVIYLIYKLKVDDLLAEKEWTFSKNNDGLITVLLYFPLLFLWQYIGYGTSQYITARK